jgi:hypothetical protein
MNQYCKLCGECMTLLACETISDLSSSDTLSHFNCLACPEYFAVFSDNSNQIIKENLRVECFIMNFYNKTGHLYLYKILPNYRGETFLKMFFLNELTHELAVQWVKRLRKFPIAFL